MQIVNVLLGGLLLVWGRRMFILFVAAAGFMAGLQIAAQVAPNSFWAGIIVGVIVAVIAAMLAMFLKTVAVGVAGFLMGGYLLGMVGGMFRMDVGLLYWGLFVVGGIAGVILMTMFFDLALIWLSSLAGTSLLVDALPWTGITRILIAVGILFIGVIIQTSQWKQDDD